MPTCKEEMNEEDVLDYMESSEFKSSIGSYELEFEKYTIYEKYFLAKRSLIELGLKRLNNV